MAAACEQQSERRSVRSRNDTHRARSNAGHGDHIGPFNRPRKKFARRAGKSVRKAWAESGCEPETFTCSKCARSTAQGNVIAPATSNAGLGAVAASGIVSHRSLEQISATCCRSTIESGGKAQRFAAAPRRYSSAMRLTAYLAQNANAFEYEYVRLGQAWLNCLDGGVDEGRKVLEELVQQMPEGNVVRGTARASSNNLMPASRCQND